MLPPEMLTGGNKKDCIRVRNLPAECGIEQILEFLGVHSQHIVSADRMELSSIFLALSIGRTRCSHGLQCTREFTIASGHDD